MLALMALNALVIDYGALWLSRSQAQNAADAAALAGALSLAFDDPDDIARAQSNAVSAGTGEPDPGGRAVDHSRDGRDTRPVSAWRAWAAGYLHPRERVSQRGAGNALPTFFAQIMGITSQDIRATATAQVTTGNAVECMKPWAVADKWDENWENGNRTPVTGRRTPSSTNTRSRATSTCPIPRC